MAIASLLDGIAEVPRAYDKWRLSSRASIGGIFMVLGVQLVVGLVLALAVRLLFGLPNNAVVNLITAGFAIGSAISGPFTMLVWSVLFFNLAGLALGLAFGVWINLPSWWHAASDQWSAGNSIPGMIFLSLIGAFVLWVAASRGFAIGWSILTMKLFDAIRNRAKGERVSREETIRTSAAKAVLPSEAEARRAIAAVDSAGEDGIILRAPSLAPRAPEPEAPPAPLTDDDRSSIYEGLASDASDPLLAGLHKDIDPLEIPLKKEGDATQTAPAPASEPAPDPVVAPPRQSASKDREQRRRRLETMVEIFIDRIHTEGAEQDVMQDFVRKNSAELKSFSASDFEMLNEIEGGANLIEASKNARGGMPFPQEAIEERIDKFAAAQMGAGTFHFEDDAADDVVSTPKPIEPERPSGGQEIAMGKRLSSLLRRAQEGELAEAGAVAPAPPQEDESVEAAVPAESVSDEGSAGTSAALMAELFPGMEIVDSEAPTSTSAPAAPVAGRIAEILGEGEVKGEDLIPATAPFGGRFGEGISASEDHEITTEDGMSFSIAPESSTDIVTGSGTMVPQETSLAGSLPLGDDSKDEEMQDDITNVPVPPQQAKEIFEILTTVHVASEQIAALRQLDTRYPYPVNQAVLSNEFVLRLGDQASAQARTRFQHIREDYLADPVLMVRKELDSLISRLRTIVSRPISVGDHRVLVIHGQVNALADKINAAPALFGDLLVEAQEMIDLLEECLVHYRGDSAASPKPPADPVPQAPLSPQDFHSTGDALSAMAPAGMSDRLAKHEAPQSAYLVERFSGQTLVGPTVEEIGGDATAAPVTAPAAVEAPPAPAADAAAALSNAVAAIEIDNEDYGFSDEELDAPDEPFSSSYPENSAGWKRERNAYDQKMEDLGRARRQREARLALERLSLDDAAGPGPAEQARFHAEMEERLASVSAREEALQEERRKLAEEQAALEEERNAVRKQRDEVISDGTDLENQRQALENLRSEIDQRSSEGASMDALSKTMLEAAKSVMLTIPDMPEDLRDPKVVELVAEFDAVKLIYRRMVPWSEFARDTRKKELAAAKIEESQADRLEPCSTTMHMLKVYGGYLARSLVNHFRDILNLAPETEASEVVAKVYEAYGDSKAIRRFAASMEDYDDSRGNGLFALTMEEQNRLAEYMKTPLSELRSINKTLEELTARAETAEAEVASLQTSVDAYRTKSERLQRDLDDLERANEGRGASRSFASERTIDDAAMDLGVDRSYVVHGVLAVPQMLERIKGAEVLTDVTAVVIGDKLFFHSVQGSQNFVEVIKVDGADSSLEPVQNVARKILSIRPDIKSWFAIGDKSKLQVMVKDRAALADAQVIDADFDEVIKHIVS